MVKIRGQEVDPPHDIFSSKKHSMDYATVHGVVERTGYADKVYWYLLLIKELLDNAIDFLWKYYPGSSDALVTATITISDSLFHIKVRNTNSRNIPVFENLPAIFDYEMTYGSKQNQHIISRGLLGDAAKQIGTWSYVLMHTEDDGREFSNKQWEIPLVIRANKRASRVLPYIDKHNQRITAPTSLVSGKLPNIDTDTEIETVWPIVDEVRESLDIHRIEKFCKQYILFTTDISFKFLLIDNSIRRSSKTKNKNNSVNIKSKKEFLSELAQVITSPAPKAPIKIDAPTFHSISTTWNNKSTIHSYTPEEFTIAFTTVHDKENTTVHDVLASIQRRNSVIKDSRY